MVSRGSQWRRGHSFFDLVERGWWVEGIGSVGASTGAKYGAMTGLDEDVWRREPCAKT